MTNQEPVARVVEQAHRFAVPNKDCVYFSSAQQQMVAQSAHPKPGAYAAAAINGAVVGLVYDAAIGALTDAAAAWDPTGRDRQRHTVQEVHTWLLAEARRWIVFRDAALFALADKYPPGAKSTGCVCEKPGASRRVCGDARGMRTPCRCACHRATAARRRKMRRRAAAELHKFASWAISVAGPQTVAEAASEAFRRADALEN